MEGAGLRASGSHLWDVARLGTWAVRGTGGTGGAAFLGSTDPHVTGRVPCTGVGLCGGARGRLQGCVGWAGLGYWFWCLTPPVRSGATSSQQAWGSPRIEVLASSGSLACWLSLPSPGALGSHCTLMLSLNFSEAVPRLLLHHPQRPADRLPGLRHNQVSPVLVLLVSVPCPLEPPCLWDPPEPGRAPLGLWRLQAAGCRWPGLCS